MQSKKRLFPIAAGVVLAIMVIAGSGSVLYRAATPKPTNTLKPSNTPKPTNTARPTKTPTNTKTPTDTKTPPPTPAPTGPATIVQVVAVPAAAVVKELVTPTPDPSREIKITLDTGKAVEQVISKDGGTISVTGSDGTQYTLVIGSNSLLSDTEVTVTPVESATTEDGTPLPVAAVQLEPDGLFMYQPAVLKVQPAQAIQAPQQVSFTYHADGKSVHYYPLDKDPTTIQFHVMHFSGFGLLLSANNPGAAPNQFQGVPGPPTDAFEEQIAMLTKQLREGQLTEGDYESQGTAAVEQFQKGVVEPDIQALQILPNPTTDQILAVTQEALVSETQYQQITGKTQDTKPGTYAAALAASMQKTRDALIKACGTTAQRQLWYSGSAQDGWFVDADTVTKVLQLTRQIGLLLGKPDLTDDQLMAALQSCRPAGYKFAGLAMAASTSQQGATVNFTFTLNGQTCGIDPYAQPWTVSGSSFITITAAGTTASHTSPTTNMSFSFNRDGSPFTMPQIGLAVSFLPGSPTLVRATLATPQFTKAGPVDALVTEDTSCPKP